MTLREQAPQERFLNRYSRSGGDEAGLTQTAADGFADVAGAGYKGVRADNHAADGGAETFGEAEREGCETRCVILK